MHAYSIDFLGGIMPKICPSNNWIACCDWIWGNLYQGHYLGDSYVLNSVALSPQANYTDWATATCWRNLVPTFMDRGVSHGQRGGSPTVVNHSFLDRNSYVLGILIFNSAEWGDGDDYDVIKYGTWSNFSLFVDNSSTVFPGKSRQTAARIVYGPTQVLFDCLLNTSLHQGREHAVSVQVRFLLCGRRVLARFHDTHDAIRTLRGAHANRNKAPAVDARVQYNPKICPR
jgi:hypothetical protein